MKNNILITKEDVYNIYEKCGFKNVRNLQINDLNLYQTALYTVHILRKNNLKILKNIMIKKYVL